MTNYSRCEHTAMHSWEILPNTILKPAGKITQMFIDIGAIDFQSAAKWVNRLPYGRNCSPADQSAVFHERRGTCSTKHALLKRLAVEQNLNVDLCIGIYYMTGRNTPGVGTVLEKRGLPMLPEAHCFLRYGHKRVDVTRATGHRSIGSMIRFIYEEAILPDQIGEYKNELHRRFLQQWIGCTPALVYTLDEVWRIREECIAALGHLDDIEVRGVDLDSLMRCTHYRGPTDIVAIKMRCCGVYYACKDCHRELADHPIEVWPESEWQRKAILCGACRTELSIRDYLTGGCRCSVCSADFNPRCQNHYHHYFEQKQ